MRDSPQNTDNDVTQPLLCIGCGQPMTKGAGFCRECVDRGFAPCASCEGISFEDVEEE